MSTDGQFMTHDPIKGLDVDAIVRAKDDRETTRNLTMQERSRLIKAACRAAARIERSKIASGLPPSRPVPWPESTWQLLKEHARNAQQPASD